MEFIQKVVWIGTVLDGATVEDFESYFKNDLGFNVKYIEEFKMTAGRLDGLNCIMFYIATEDISKFMMFRVTTDDMKWWEDFYDNYHLEGGIPQDIINRHRV